MRTVFGISIVDCDMPGILGMLSVAHTYPLLSWTVCLVNAASVVEAHRNPRHMEALLDADIRLADGAGVALLARTQKIAGADLMLAAAQHRLLGKMRHVLLGGFGVAYRAALAQWKASGATALVRAPWIPETQLTDLVDLANKVPCDILWVALGCPKQEIWMMENRHRLKAKVIIGVGAAFDFLAGRVQRAPKWMQPIGLEWAWRIYQEPGRWGRQVGAAIGFLSLVATSPFRRL